MSQIGSVVAIPFIGPALDTWGRRWGMFIGGMGIMIGVTIQTCTIRNPSVGQFMAGRFLMGWGIGIITTAGPTYVVEVSHPAYRGIYTGLYNVLWPVGSIVASGAARGGYSYHGNTTWLIPVGLQMMFPGIVVLFFWFLPESPRWLYTHGQRAKAAAFLAEHHGSGNPESEWVKLQLVEYEEHLEMNGADRRWWDYRALFGNRASIYRLMANCFVALFGQWAGNGMFERPCSRINANIDERCRDIFPQRFPRYCWHPWIDPSNRHYDWPEWSSICVRRMRCVFG